MKKIISTLIVIAMVSSLFCFNAFALSDSDYYYTLTASKTEDVKAGDVISVYVHISTTESVDGIQTFIKYDTSLFDGPYTYYDEDEEVDVEVGYADDFDKTFPSLTNGQKINNTGGYTAMTLDPASGTFGAIYTRKDPTKPVTAANAINDLVVLGDRKSVV